MITRSGICLILVSMLSLSLGACSTVPDRYAPWRDTDNTTAGKTPNLGDVPTPPNVADTKAQMDDMRQRLETDRNNAYLAAQGVVPMDNAPSAPAPSLAPAGNMPQVSSGQVIDSDLAPPSSAPAMAAPTAPQIASTNLPAPAPQAVQQIPQTMAAGNVYYNYDPGVGNAYTYGYNAPINGPSVQTNSPDAMVSSDDPSVAIDLSVLGGSSNSHRTTLSANGLTTGEPIAYFAHGSAKLGPKDRAAIKQLAQQLKSSSQSVTVAGNASKRTGVRNVALSRQINLKMSERRANAVMDELIKLGISPQQIFISAYGDALPNMRRDGGHNEAANRRVEVIFDQ